jgi:hypothetical protein
MPRPRILRVWVLTLVSSLMNVPGLSPALSSPFQFPISIFHLRTPRATLLYQGHPVEYLIGALFALAVAGLAILIGFDRDRLLSHRAHRHRHLLHLVCRDGSFFAYSRHRNHRRQRILPLRRTPLQTKSLVRCRCPRRPRRSLTPYIISSSKTAASPRGGPVSAWPSMEFSARCWVRGC